MNAKHLLLVVLAVMAISALGACGGGEKGPFVMVWYPNESGEDLKAARDEVGAIIEKATGRKVEHKTTTDYSIAIETLVNNNADMAWLGPQGYVEAHSKNDKILPLVTNSGASGTLKDAVYYAWLCVRKGDEEQYKSGDSYSIDNIQGKRFSFVSSSSTSGFKVPSSGIVAWFSKMPKWAGLKQEELLEGGKDKFFSEVLFGGSHQGAAVNLLAGKCDVAAYCDEVLDNYVELVEGQRNTPGAVYRVRQDASDPLAPFAGREYVIIRSVPVLNSPFAYNSGRLGKDEVEKLLALFTSDEVAQNPKMFVPKDSSFKGFFKKASDNVRFLAVDDAWFEPIRALSK